MHPYRYLARLMVGLVVLLSWGLVPAGAQEHSGTSPDPAARAATDKAPAAGEAGEHGVGGHAEPNILSGDLGNIFFTLLIFLIVVFVLGKYAWPLVLNVLNERERTIRESLEQARREREEAERVLEKYTRQIEQARGEASRIVDAGRRNAEEVARRVHEEARGEAGQMVVRARREIQLATDAAKKEVYDLAAELAVDVAGRMIRKELSAGDHKELVAESLARMRAEGARTD